MLLQHEVNSKQTATECRKNDWFIARFFLTKTDFCYFYIFKSFCLFYFFFLPFSQFQVKEEVRQALNSQTERKGGFLPGTCLSCIIKVNGKKRSGHELPEMSRKACFWPIAAEFLSLPAKTFS